MGKKPILQTEINYSMYHIKRLTPYLDNVKRKARYRGYDVLRPINGKQRAFAWYYVYNDGIIADAFRRAYKSKYDPKQKRLVPDKNADKGNGSVDGAVLMSKPYIQQAIHLINAELERTVLDDLPPSMLKIYTTLASFDPADFINPDGTVRFESWEEIPPALRRCVESIEVRYHGHKADKKTVHIKFVNRFKYLKELQKLAPRVFEPDKRVLIHKTIDRDGAEVGLDLSRHTDDELMKMVGNANSQVIGNIDGDISNTDTADGAPE